MLTKKRTFEILNKAKYGDTASRIFDISLTILILANLAAVSLESVESWLCLFFLSNMTIGP